MTWIKIDYVAKEKAVAKAKASNGFHSSESQVATLRQHEINKL